MCDLTFTLDRLYYFVCSVRSLNYRKLTAFLTSVLCELTLVVLCRPCVPYDRRWGHDLIPSNRMKQMWITKYLPRLDIGLGLCGKFSLQSFEFPSTFSDRAIFCLAERDLGWPSHGLVGWRCHPSSIVVIIINESIG